MFLLPFSCNWCIEVNFRSNFKINEARERLIKMIVQKTLNAHFTTIFNFKLMKIIMTWVGETVGFALFSKRWRKQPAHSAPRSLRTRLLRACCLCLKLGGNSFLAPKEEGASLISFESMIAPCPVSTADSIVWEETSTLRGNGKPRA